MNNIVELLLQYPETNLVHQYFSNLVGMYHKLITSSGDLMNTIRSPEMRTLWTFLQPLKRRVGLVDEKNIHFLTTQMVHQFLEDFENQVASVRNDRISQLKKQVQTGETQKEIEQIREALKNMKRVDEYDRIITNINSLKSKFPTIPVKFYYPLQLTATYIIKGFPEIPKPLMAFVNNLHLNKIQRYIIQNINPDTFNSLSGFHQQKHVHEFALTYDSTQELLDVNYNLYPEMLEPLANLTQIIVDGLKSIYIIQYVENDVNYINNIINVDNIEPLDLSKFFADISCQQTFIREDFTCPLSCDIFEDPFMFGGHIYDRVYLEQWLRTDTQCRIHNVEHSPLTRRSQF